MREHMAGKVEMGEAKLSEEEMQFHYFKVHDYDNNNKLDGIEIISALTHHHRGTVSSLAHRHCSMVSPYII